MLTHKITHVDQREHLKAVPVPLIELLGALLGELFPIKLNYVMFLFHV